MAVPTSFFQPIDPKYKPKSAIFNPDEVLYTNWEEWFAWYPVQSLTTGKRIWFRKIVRRFVHTIRFPRSGYYQYGTIFDILMV